MKNLETEESYTDYRVPNIDRWKKKFETNKEFIKDTNIYVYKK